MRLKISWQDVASGLLLLAIAVIGYELNGEHPLGTVRRMGPGYMPMLTFWILGVIGLAVFVGGLFSGPDIIDAETRREVAMSLIAIGAFGIAVVLEAKLGKAGWIPHVLLMGAMAIVCLALKSSMLPIMLSMYFFWAALERWGFVVAIIGSVAIAGLAERPVRVVRMAGTALGLLALCWAIFIWYLDIRVPLLPQQIW